MASLVSENPDAIPGAEPPVVGRYRVNGTTLHAEIRGSGRPLLLIGAADEDAEFFRPLAERLTTMAVVTYDRRGTGRSGRDEWPGGGSGRHADDAAALIDALGLGSARVFGASAGGIVALQLALRHPHVVDAAVVFEPGYFRHARGGEEMLQSVYGQVDEYLSQRPDDWAGAVSVLGRAISATLDPGSPGFFAAPRGREWYSERALLNAESLVRGDLALTLEEVAVDELVSAPVGLRFAYGALSLPIFREITTRLAAVRCSIPDRLDDVGHAVYHNPDAVADYISAYMG